MFVPDRELAQELLTQHAAEPLRQFLQHLERKLGAKAIEGKDIDHKTPVRANGGHGGNNMANLRVRSRHANRGWDKKR